jgi:hypothetical protein
VTDDYSVCFYEIVNNNYSSCGLHIKLMMRDIDNVAKEDSFLNA